MTKYSLLQFGHRVRARREHQFRTTDCREGPPAAPGARWGHLSGSEAPGSLPDRPQPYRGLWGLLWSILAQALPVAAAKRFDGLSRVGEATLTAGLGFDGWPPFRDAPSVKGGRAPCGVYLGEWSDSKPRLRLGSGS